MPCFSVPKSEKPNVFATCRAAERDADDGAELRPQRLDVADLLEVAADLGSRASVLVGDQLVLRAAGGKRIGDGSAASMPDSMALWLPLMRGTLTKPAEQPISAPPGNVSFGTDCQPPSVMARAP